MRRSFSRSRELVIERRRLDGDATARREGALRKTDIDRCEDLVGHVLERAAIDVAEQAQIEALQNLPSVASSNCPRNIHPRIVSSADRPPSRANSSPRSKNAAYRSAFPRG